VGEGWARGGLIITCFNIYIFHVKKFTSKINEEGEEGLVCEKEERKRKKFALGEVDVEGEGEIDDEQPAPVELFRRQLCVPHLYHVYNSL
jgi:hypothetical protein